MNQHIEDTSLLDAYKREAIEWGKAVKALRNDAHAPDRPPPTDAQQRAAADLALHHLHNITGHRVGEEGGKE